MPTDRRGVSDAGDGPNLAAFLTERRARCEPTAYGFERGRRRTPGLRREEVAQLARVSTTWYTWLEQGRESHPSAEALERIGRALRLSRAEHEHLFLLAQNRPPPLRASGEEAVSPRLQRTLDAMPFSPALVRSPIWDLLAWNEAARRILADYAALPPGQRNVLRMLFGDPSFRRSMPEWEHDVRHITAAFRADLARTGSFEAASGLIAELQRSSPEFRAWWADGDVAVQGEGTKLVRHAIAGLLTFDYSSFGVDGTNRLALVVYTPATAADLARVKRVMRAAPAPAPVGGAAAR